MSAHRPRHLSLTLQTPNLQTEWKTIYKASCPQGEGNLVSNLGLSAEHQFHPHICRAQHFVG